MEDVLINFVGKVDQLAPAENALEGIIAKEGEVGAAWKKTSDAMNAQTKISTDNTNKLSKSIENLAASTKSMDKAVIGGAYSNYLKQIQQQLGLTNKEVIAYIKNARAAAQEKIITDATQQEVDELTLSIEVMNDQLKLFEGAGAGAEEKTKSLRARLRETKEELVAMAEAGMQNTPAFEALRKKAGELDDQMKDLNSEISNIGSDTRNIEGLVGIAGGVAGGFAAAQGAMALFGGESEDIQKALLKVNAAMSILQGLQQIQILLQKESAASLLISRIATGAQTAATTLFATATAGATTSLRVFKTALVTTGVGAIVVALGFLIEKLINAKDAQDEYNGSIEDYLKLNDAELEGIKTAGTKIDQELQRRGAGQAARTKADGLNLIEQKKAIQRTILQIENSSSEVTRTKEQNDELAKLYSKRDNLNLEISQKKIDYDKQVTEEAKQESEKRKSLSEKELALEEKNAQAKFEIIQRSIQERISLDEKEIGDETATYESRLSALARYLFDKKELLNLQEAFEKSKRGLTADEILNIEDDFNKRQEQLVAEGMSKRNAVYKQYNDQLFEQEKARQEQMAQLFDEEVGIMNKSIEGVFNRIDQKNAGLLDDELNFLKTFFDAGLLSLEDYEKEREAVKSKYEIKTIENNIKQTQSLIANNKLYGLSTTSLEKQLFDEKELLRQKDLESHKKANKEKEDDDKKTAEKRKQVEKQIKEAALTVAKEVVDTIFEIKNQDRENQLNKDLGNLQKAKEAELSNKNLTEEQKNAIDKKYKKLESDLRIKAFEQDKVAKRSQAIISGALAIIQAFAQLGPVAGGIAAGVIAITTGLQIDRINRATPPPPAFKKGKVNIDGPGTETSDSITARISKGESVIKASSTKKWEDALHAINNDDFEGYLMKAFKQFIFPNVPSSVQPSAGGSLFDYDKLAVAIATKIPEPTYIQNNIDESGFHRLVTKNNNRIEIKNKRYSIS